MQKPVLTALVWSVILVNTGFLFAQTSGANIKFEDPKYNFSFVRQGEVVKFEYRFENTGDEPLVIADAQVECGCTVVEKPEQPVKKGEKAVIKVSFDTKSTIDRQDRAITVISNAKNSPSVLRFKGVVLKPKKKA